MTSHIEYEAQCEAIADQLRTAGIIGSNDIGAPITIRGIAHWFGDSEKPLWYLDAVLRLPTREDDPKRAAVEAIDRIEAALPANKITGTRLIINKSPSGPPSDEPERIKRWRATWSQVGLDIWLEQ